MATQITKLSFLLASVENISQVYAGKRNHCRCGCGGTYIATSYMNNPRSEVNDKIVHKRLKRAQRLIDAGASFEAGETYFDVETGDNKTLTFYFDELK